VNQQCPVDRISTIFTNIGSVPVAPTAPGKKFIPIFKMDFGVDFLLKKTPTPPSVQKKRRFFHLRQKYEDKVERK
jgi:hypothetical protein